MEKVLNVLSEGYQYLGRIDRAKHIIKSIKEFTEECEVSKKDVYIRMRTAFGSMSNIIHYGDKEISDLNLAQQKELDKLLIEERNSIINLLNLDNAKLKCICWPKIRFLKHYTDI